MVPLPFIPRRAIAVLAAIACASVTAPVIAPAIAQPAPAAPAAPPASSTRLDPTDARVPVPQVQHRSALAGYRALTDVPAIPWREANDTVTRIGGWRSYAREARAPQPPASAPAAAPMQHKH